MNGRPIAVLGGGAWGTALAVILAQRAHAVRLYARSSELVERMLGHRDNPAYLPGVRIPDGVQPVADPALALEGAGLAIVAVPSPFVRALLRRAGGALAPDAALALATKGIEEETLALPSEVVEDVLGARRSLVVLSGPSFAPEVARGRPAAIVAASTEPALATSVQKLFSGSRVRVYTNGDPRGVQLAGALKNVIAIAAGVVDGLDMGSGAVAALVTRGVAEMARLGIACGGRPGTFSGLAGLGDLVLTCTGSLSRNRRVGQALGRGERLVDILGTMRSFAEGVATTRAARALALRHQVEMPIVEEVHRLLYEEGLPEEGLARLLARPLTSEEPPRESGA